MKRTSLNELQKALYDTLSGEYNVYDNVPEKPLYPYLIIGRDNAIDRSTKTYFAEEVTIQLNFFSLYRGYKEVKTLADEIVEKLHMTEFFMPSFRIYSRKLILVDSLFGTNPDSKEYREIVIKYRFYIDEKGI